MGSESGPTLLTSKGAGDDPSRTQATPAAGSQPARRALGAYEILGFLGKGGMGCVYRGMDRSLQRPVAIKELAPHLMNDKGLVDRFMQEARLVARVNHPNICDVYFLGFSPDTGAPFFAMELIEGQGLDRLIATGGPIPAARALDLARQTAEALKVAHAAGVVHRDVKPANILVTHGGQVKVTDFGLAKLVGSGPGLTQANVIMGTPHYMSPEVAAGKPCDHRSDMYSLGVTLFHMLTGRVPFDGPSTIAVITSQVNDPPPEVRTLRGDVPPAVAAFVARLLAKRPDDRFATWDELIAGLEKVAAGSPLPQTRPPAAAAALAASSQAVKAATSTAVVVVGHLAPRASVRRRWKLKLALAPLVALASWLFVLGQPGMVYVPGGAYRVGPPGRLTEVTLAPYWIDRYEVTDARYKTATGVKDAAQRSLPRIFASADDVTRYLEATGLSLPTDAQWQVAACGPGALPLPWGETTEASELGDGVCASHLGLSQPSPVGASSRDVSPFGCHDMAGNLRECVTWEAPTNPPKGPVHALMGASFLCELTPSSCAVQPHRWYGLDFSDGDVGVRCVKPATFVARAVEWLKLALTVAAIAALVLFL